MGIAIMLQATFALIAVLVIFLPLLMIIAMATCAIVGLLGLSHILAHHELESKLLIT